MTFSTSQQTKGVEPSIASELTRTTNRFCRHHARFSMT
jgi:hypothetical protein